MAAKDSFDAFLSIIKDKVDEFSESTDQSNIQIFKNEIFYIEGDYIWGRKEKLIGWRSSIKNYSATLGAGIHLIDLIIWILNDKPKSVISFGNKIGTKDSKFKKKSFVINIFNKLSTHQRAP